VIYEEGKVITKKYDTIASDSLYALLKGKWLFSWPPSGRVFQVFDRGGSNSYQYDFISKSEVVFKYVITGKTKTMTANWKFENNTLFIAGENLQKQFFLIFLSNDELILKSIE
jgi:hypothetical protein